MNLRVCVVKRKGKERKDTEQMKSAQTYPFGLRGVRRSAAPPRDRRGVLLLFTTGVARLAVV